MNPSYTQLIQRSWDIIKSNLALSVGLTVVLSLAAMALNMIPFVGGLLVTPITIGYLVCLLKLRRNEEFSWEDFFWAFADLNRVLHLTILTLITGLGAMIGFILLIVPGIWFSIASSLAIPIFVLGEKDGVAAVKKSMEIVKGRWTWFFGLFFVLALLNLAGALCLLLGLLFTIPVSTLVAVIAYEHFAGKAPVSMDTGSTPAPVPTPIN
jgi:hypothetical protein